MKNKKHDVKSALTVADVVTCIAIVVGLVAIISLFAPNWIEAYNAKKLKEAFWAANLVVQDAKELMLAEGKNIQTLEFNELKKYFKTNGVEREVSRYTNPYRNMTDTRDAKDAHAHILKGSFDLENGMTVLTARTREKFYSPAYTTLVIDINGIKSKPNKYGHDVFFWYQSPDTGEFTTLGAQALNGKVSKYSQLCDWKNRDAENGCGCAIKAINDPDWFKNLK